MRTIPSLLINNEICYKSSNFKINNYFGDPINIIRNLSEFEISEIFIAYPNNKINNSYNFLKKLAYYSKYPLTYSGNIKTITEIKKIINAGFEKISINYFSFINNQLYKASEIIGSQSICVILNIIKKNNQYFLINLKNKKMVNLSINKHNFFQNLNQLSFGEILINDINLDGSDLGYDESLIDFFYKEIKSPILIQGGSTNILNCKKLYKKYSQLGFVGSSFFFINSPLKSFLIKDIKI